MSVLNRTKAILDIKRGLKMYPLWSALAWQDTKQRYRRSTLGPFWITASTGIMVLAMGPLYGVLLGQNVTTYIQHLAVSLIIWTFISSSINDAGNVFIGAEGYIKQISLPLTVHVLRLISKNLLMFAHNVVIILVVLLFIPPTNLSFLWSVPIGLALVSANLAWLVLLLGMLSTRFRDIPQLVTNIVQVAFFLSPIIWKASMLSEKNRFLAELNPLYHLLEIIRAPLLGDASRAISWIVCLGLLIFGGGITYLVFARLRARVPYWL